ncbi:MAG: nucleotidyltransferase domain-containing protein [Proteobacteria bacterium]|nr:nucleotidyltransferase domain-containing protein [Pseudomonadota bacterium]
MAKSKNITIINFFGKQLKARGLNISKIILFGSQARGGATAGSDIDIAIVSVDFRGKDIFKRVELINKRNERPSGNLWFLWILFLLRLKSWKAAVP